MASKRFFTSKIWAVTRRIEDPNVNLDTDTTPSRIVFVISQRNVVRCAVTQDFVATKKSVNKPVHWAKTRRLYYKDGKITGFVKAYPPNRWIPVEIVQRGKTSQIRCIIRRGGGPDDQWYGQPPR
jgi:hypothetical protein